MTIEDIEEAVANLPPHQFAQFRAWFEEFDAARFDQRIERDANAGKLDAVADEASTIFARVMSASYEAFREPLVLGGVRETSRTGPRRRR
jgi:hypothetical protein